MVESGRVAELVRLELGPLTGSAVAILQSRIRGSPLSPADRDQYHLLHAFHLRRREFRQGTWHRRPTFCQEMLERVALEGVAGATSMHSVC